MFIVGTAQGLRPEETRIKATILAGGTWTAFRLAEQFHQRGALDQLVTTHPPLRGERIPRELIHWNPWPEILMRGPWPIDRPYAKAAAFSKWAARHVGGGDLLVAWAQFALPSLAKARMLGIPSVLVRQSLHVDAQREILGAPRTKLWARELEEYQHATYIEVPTTLAIKSFTDRGFPVDKLLLVPPVGVDLAVFHPGVRTNDFHAITVGISHRKGTQYALEGCRRAGVVVWVVGRPEDASWRRNYTEPADFVGPLPQRRLADLFRRASVCVIASLEEGLPHVLVEALACGCPVVATTTSGAGDVIRDGREGFIVPPSDARAIASAVEWLRDDEEKWTAMSAAAAETGRTWTWDRYGACAFDAYQRVMASR